MRRRERRLRSPRQGPGGGCFHGTVIWPLQRVPLGRSSVNPADGLPAAEAAARASRAVWPCSGVPLGDVRTGAEPGRRRLFVREGHLAVPVSATWTLERERARSSSSGGGARWGIAGHFAVSGSATCAPRARAEPGRQRLVARSTRCHFALSRHLRISGPFGARPLPARRMSHSRQCHSRPGAAGTAADPDGSSRLIGTRASAN